MRQRQLSSPYDLVFSQLLVVFLLLVLALVASVTESFRSSNNCYHYKHLVVLVHGYLGSHKEQSYLGETLASKAKPLNNPSYCQRHEFLVHLSKANQGDTTDGVVKGGERLASEIQEWINWESYKAKQQNKDDNEEVIVTLSLVGNSLGGLFSRYAAAELLTKSTEENEGILPLVFCTTSSPHLGVSNETFIPLSRWAEELMGNAMAQTGRDLFLVDDIVVDMCLPPNENRYLSALRQFQKRIAVANAYNTDFLVSVSSGAFLSTTSDSKHYTMIAGDDSDNTKLMENEHVILQVETTTASATSSQEEDDNSDNGCVDNLDRLGWHKIFLDTRSALPDWLNILDNTPPIPQNRTTFTSTELQDLFARYGTLLPIAHPLNMANSKTDWYSLLTASGRPIMDSLADLLIHDMIQLSESYTTRKKEDNGDEESESGYYTADEGSEHDNEDDGDPKEEL